MKGQHTSASVVVRRSLYTGENTMPLENVSDTASFHTSNCLVIEEGSSSHYSLQADNKSELEYLQRLETTQHATSWMSKLKHVCSAYFNVALLCLWFLMSVAAALIDLEKSLAMWVLNLTVALTYLVSKLFNLPRVIETRVVTIQRMTDFWHTHPQLQTATPLIVTLTLFVLMVCFAYDSVHRLISIVGLVVFISLAYAGSWNRAAISWRPVLWGFSAQFFLALLICKTHAGRVAFTFLSEQITALLAYSEAGSILVFGHLVTDAHTDGSKYIFVVMVLPTIIFFSSLISILYYLGVLQCVIAQVARGMELTLGTSATESIVAAGNIFIGMTEAPLLVRPFLAQMTKSELHAIMTGGFASISGGVLVAFIQMGIAPLPLLTATVMAAPAALAVSKLVYPETERNHTSSSGEGGGVMTSASSTPVVLEKGNETNIIEAASNGASIAVELALNITGMLIAFTALVTMVDAAVAYLGSRLGWPGASFTNAMAYAFYPVAFLLGVPTEDCLTVGQLIGRKICLNEFIAYADLQQLIVAKTLSARAELIATYALCGFANFSSVGVVLGGLGPLAPSRKSDLAQLVMSAMVCGNLTCFITACMAGLISH